MDLVNERFTPALPWVTGHLQTIAERVRPTHHHLAAAGTQVRLVVQLPGAERDALAVRVHRPPAVGLRPKALVLLVHGLGGTIESSYIRASALGLLRAGHQVARVDLRGVGESREHSRLLYHGGRTDDLRAVLRALADEPGAHGLALMGFSLGGNAVLKLLGEPLEGLPVVGGVAVSAPLDLAAASEHIHHLAGGLYERVMMRRLRADAVQPELALTAAERERVLAAATLAEFDSIVTAAHNGWRDAAEYYAVNSSGQFLPRIGVPTLVIHAIDDPMVPAGSYTAVDWQALARLGWVLRAITPHGGHVGFHAHGHDLPWFVDRAVHHFGVTSAVDEPAS